MATGTKFQDHLDLELKDSDFAAAYLAPALEDGGGGRKSIVQKYF